jgi:L-asparagine transporter-like permease
MWGFPWATLLGLGLMLAVLVTTAFVPVFRMTLVFGVPFLLLLAAAYGLFIRKAGPGNAAGESSHSPVDAT